MSQENVEIVLSLAEARSALRAAGRRPPSRHGGSAPRSPFGRA